MHQMILAKGLFFRSLIAAIGAIALFVSANASDEPKGSLMASGVSAKAKKQSDTKTNSAEQKNKWNKKMGELLQALTGITPDLFSPQPDSANSPSFREKVKKIFEVSRTLDQNDGHGMKAPDDDPGLAYLSRMFREDMERAAQSLESGSPDYARSVLKSSVSYCIACHTRTQSGPQFPLIAALEKPLEGARWVEKISFKAATRQFDEVITEVMSKLETGASPSVKAFELEKAVRIAMTIAVRVKNDPERALLLAKKVSDSVQTPDQLKERSRTWIKDIRQWQEERSTGKEKELESDKSLMSAAHKVLGRSADESSLEELRRDGSEIKSLRATLFMHRLLREHRKSQLVPEALYLIGASYEALGDLGFWNLSDLYFKSCIHHAPHSARGEICYRRYEENVVLGFTGSSGTHLPHAVDAHLKEVKALAWRKTEKK